MGGFIASDIRHSKGERWLAGPGRLREFIDGPTGVVRTVEADRGWPNDLCYSLARTAVVKQQKTYKPRSYVDSKIATQLIQSTPFNDKKKTTLIVLYTVKKVFVLFFYTTRLEGRKFKKMVYNNPTFFCFSIALRPLWNMASLSST